jgi:hypothetical protein
MTAPHSLSLVGCRTKAEARRRLAAWLAEIHRDNQHQLRTDLFAARDDGDIGQDGNLEAIMTAVDDAVAMARQHWEENIGATLAQFDRILDSGSLEPSDGQVD